ncbi:Hypothetical predicted protein [Olea europaea subsp. europaea]|uniref:Uncharacterized protein n=1 Tax=Olea europaea subsp. europaea TaxID=158383 RepID=A0A8S0SE32_OLEEU|nr:Hypothetical predicted protein [Olea europaea subsp. europaea]
MIGVAQADPVNAAQYDEKLPRSLQDSLSSDPARKGPGDVAHEAAEAERKERVANAPAPNVRLHSSAQHVLMRSNRPLRKL